VGERLEQQVGPKRGDPEAGQQLGAVAWFGLSHVPSGPGDDAGQPRWRLKMLKR